MSATPRGTVKGSILEARLTYLRRQADPTLALRVLARVPEADRQLYLAGIVPVAWYPFEMNERLDLAIGDELGHVDETFRALGVASALHNLTSASQLHYIRKRNPHGMLKQASAIYGAYYGSGRRTYERVADTRAVLQTRDSKSFSLADCLTVVGWHEKAIELCGGRQVRVVEAKCRARGDDVCEYVCDWVMEEGPASGPQSGPVSGPVRER
jgi:uncharacterized protein (TIGR02265 family)